MTVAAVSAIRVADQRPWGFQLPDNLGALCGTVSP
jgi:hypothetical protein